MSFCFEAAIGDSGLVIRKGDAVLQLLLYRITNHRSRIPATRGARR